MNLPKFGKRKWCFFMGLALVIPNVIPSQALAAGKQTSYAYVAVGDSLTTGSSVASCQENRRQSPWGCGEHPTAAVPYPDRVAQQFGYSYSDNPQLYSRLPGSFSPEMLRVGIWGYTLQEATRAKRTGHNQQGAWQPQLLAAEHATALVTGALGINDMHFSDVKKWAKLYISPGRDKVTEEATSIVAAHAQDLDSFFASLQVARENGASVVITLYYNPYDTDNSRCTDLRTIGDRIVNTLDTELLVRAHAAGFAVADFRRPFLNHGSGSADPFVFGTQCSLANALADWLPEWLGGGGGTKALGVGFDPHPNNKGTLAMSQRIMEEINNAD